MNTIELHGHEGVLLLAFETPQLARLFVEHMPGDVERGRDIVDYLSYAPEGALTLLIEGLVAAEVRRFVRSDPEPERDDSPCDIDQLAREIAERPLNQQVEEVHEISLDELNALAEEIESESLLEDTRSVVRRFS